MNKQAGGKAVSGMWGRICIQLQQCLHFNDTNITNFRGNDGRRMCGDCRIICVFTVFQILAQ